MKKVLIIDDDRLFLSYLGDYIRERCPDLEVITCVDPFRGLAEISPDIDLLLLDLEMPGIDGRKLVDFARGKGVDKSRIIILSGHDAEYLHECIPMGECLAVMNKHEARQKAVLDMIIDSLAQKSVAP